ncbi:MAG: hypothetical protein ACI9DC_003451 [Gammaproteobacteria bacterium]|jgi:hypothetical protein
MQEQITDQRPWRATRALVGLWLMIGAGLGLCHASEQSADLTTLLDTGDALAQVSLGQRYEHGEGVAQNYDHAVRLYCRAAHSGHRDASYQLGWMYANGRGVARDDAQAAAWFKAAADKGDEFAEKMLSRLPPAGKEPQCIRPNGTIVERPIRSEPNPSPALIVRWVHKLAPKYRLDPALVLAVIRAESNFNPKARSPKNAQGLMQLIPGTAKRFAVDDVWDPLQNIRGGMAYLRWLLDHFAGDEALALAGYNAGENAVRRYNGIPPYPETRSYVKRVSRWRRLPAAIPAAKRSSTTAGKPARPS